MSKKHREPDLIGELQDEANWSTWRNTFRPIRGSGRRFPSDPSIPALVITGLIGTAILIGFAFAFALVLSLLQKVL